MNRILSTEVLEQLEKVCDEHMDAWLEQSVSMAANPYLLKKLTQLLREAISTIGSIKMCEITKTECLACHNQTLKFIETFKECRW